MGTGEATIAVGGGHSNRGRGGNPPWALGEATIAIGGGHSNRGRGGNPPWALEKKQ